MSIEELTQQINQAVNIIKAAERLSKTVAEILPGNLRKIDTYTAAKLKKELRGFNLTTHQWKDL